MQRPPQIQNIICTMAFTPTLDLAYLHDTVELLAGTFDYKVVKMNARGVFRSITLHPTAAPKKAKIRIHPSHLNFLGFNSMDSIHNMALFIEMLVAVWGVPEPFVVTKTKVSNVVTNSRLGRRVLLERIRVDTAKVVAAFGGCEVHYEPELFPGLCIKRIRGTSLTIVMFTNGSVNMMGVADVDEHTRTWEILKKVVEPYYIREEVKDTRCASKPIKLAAIR